RRRDDQDPPLLPPKESDQNGKKRHDFDASTAKQPQAQTSLAWKKFDKRKAPSSLSKQNIITQSEQPVNMEECHLLLTNQIDLVNPESHRVVPSVSKPLPLGGPPGQVTIQPQYFFNKDLKYLVSGDKDRRNSLSISKLKAAYYPDFGLKELVPLLWIESEREYDISAAYEIVLHRADYKDYKISKVEFKNLHPNDFEYMYLLHLQGNLNHLSRVDKVALFNTVNLWIRNIVIRHCMEDLQLALVEKLIDEDIVRQKAITELAVQFDNASIAKEDIRKAYEKCNDIPQENRALIDTFLEQESDKYDKMHLALFRKAEKIEQQMNTKFVWL
nr:hypothetical protein [Tanacetum cinerariifolium]